MALPLNIVSVLVLLLGVFVIVGRNGQCIVVGVDVDIIFLKARNFCRKDIGVLCIFEVHTKAAKTILVVPYAVVIFVNVRQGSAEVIPRLGAAVTAKVI
ncbi:hypothetical protein SDC9_145497 [bioreactor metagenome]|uniref:Uncharacterized protein n=1 Tax=bioreactor metagenome TaxID=1076179 RepID=A0A645ECD1_9ZZZZ